MSFSNYVNKGLMNVVHAKGKTPLAKNVLFLTSELLGDQRQIFVTSFVTLITKL